MRREIFAILLLSFVAGAALDQTYVHEVSRNGDSVVEKSMELTVFSNQLTPGALERMSDACEHDSRLGCSVDVEKKLVVLSQELSPGAYYRYSTEYGLPSIAYTISIDRIPTDRFSDALGDLLAAANATEVGQVRGTVKPLSLTERDENAANAGILKALGAKITYRVVMPSRVTYAAAGGVQGAIDGNSADFAVVDVMADSAPLVVRCEELNWGYLLLIAMVAVLGALAYLFMKSGKPMKKSKKK